MSLLFWLMEWLFSFGTFQGLFLSGALTIWWSLAEAIEKMSPVTFPNRFLSPITSLIARNYLLMAYPPSIKVFLSLTFLILSNGYGDIDCRNRLWDISPSSKGGITLKYPSVVSRFGGKPAGETVAPNAYNLLISLFLGEIGEFYVCYREFEIFWTRR